MPCRLGDDEVDRCRGGGNCLGTAGENFDPCVIGGEHGTHPLVGLDGRQVRDPVGQQPGEDAGTGSDFEHIARGLWNQPVECFIRGAGSEAVVLLRHLAERTAQDGGVLVLAHERHPSETVDQIDFPVAKAHSANASPCCGPAAFPRGVSGAINCSSTRKWRSGSASPCQGEGRGFESRLPLQKTGSSDFSGEPPRPEVPLN